MLEGRMLKRFRWQAVIVAGLLVALGVGSYALAGGSSRQLRADRMTGYAEAASVSSVGTGSFRGTLDENANTLTYTLHYSDLEGAVQQSHIHFGQRNVSGGIVLFLCTNLGNGPAGTQACPAPPATVTGVLHPSDIVNIAAAQGITGAGDDAADIAEWNEIERAIRAGKTYVNVHSTKFPSGEIRSQIDRRGPDPTH